MILIYCSSEGTEQKLLQYHTDGCYEEKTHWFDGNSVVSGANCLRENTRAGTGGTEE